MKLLKRLTVCILSAALIVTLAGCATDTTPADSSNIPDDSSQSPADSVDTPDDISSDTSADNPSDNTDTPSDNTDTPSDNADTPSDNADNPSDNADTPSDTQETPPMNITPDTLSAQIAKADYPQTPHEPAQMDYLSDSGAFDSEGYSRDWEAWFDVQQDIAARMDEQEEGLSRLTPFLISAAQQFLTRPESNQTFSPMNIYMALAMLSELTDGDSRAQILNLLGAENIDALREQASTIWDALYTDGGAATILLGSSVWLNNEIHFREDTLQRLAEIYHASSNVGEMGSPEFNAALQTWLNELTRGLVSEQASGIEMDERTLMALATTIYFKAPWTDQFNPARTITDVFHAVDGDTQAAYMRRTFTGIYHNWAGFTAVSVPLSVGQIGGGRMWLILPEENRSVDELAAGNDVWEFLFSREHESTGAQFRIHLSLPKFDVSSDLDLIPGLRSMGVTDVFDYTVSDFTPMTSDSDQIEVDQARHAARVKINEEGCEAAAFTVMAMAAGAAPMDYDTVDFTLDRPFLFAVTDSYELPLFAGIVHTPSAG